MLGVAMIMGVSVVMIIVGCCRMYFRAMLINIVDLMGVVEWRLSVLER